METWDCASGCPVAALDAQSGVSKSAGGRLANISTGQRVYGAGRGLGQDLDPDAVRGDPGFGDTGGASRFFYCAKASRVERNAGLGGSDTPALEHGATMQEAEDTDWSTRNGNYHPTVKPIEVVRWVTRLIVKRGGVVLDLFAGSGSHGCAAVMEGVNYIGIERNAGYVRISRARIAWWAAHPEGLPTELILRRPQAPADQLALL